MTTKAKTSGHLKGANAALRYLQNVQATISPLHDILKTSFSFPDERSRRGTTGYRAGTDRSPSVEDDLERITGLPANEHALWNRATDFWHIVGWAFNCSVTHKKRWERWRLWLELMLDFLEVNWAANVRRSKLEDVNKEETLMGSLLWHYISSEDPTNRSNRRRMVRAILARGTTPSKGSFTEIWHNETAERKPVAADEKSLANIDIDNGELGEFGGVDEDEAMPDAPRLSLRTSRRSQPPKKSQSDDDNDSANDDSTNPIHDTESAISRFGGMDAIILRQRLFALLAQVSLELPTQFTKLSDLFDPITEEFTPLPTMMYSILLSTSRLPELEQAALNANLLLPLVTGQLPDFTQLEPTQMHLEQYLLPRRATTQSFAANAKISLIVEQIFLYMMNIKGLTATDALRTAVEKGITERNSVFGTAKGKKGNAAEEDVAKKMLEASAMRLSGMLEVLEISAGKPPQPSSRRKSEGSSFMSSLSELSSNAGSGTEDDR